MQEPRDRLKDLREKKGFKRPTDFARAYNINETTYRAHESGVRGLTVEAATKYAKIHGVRASWLLTGEDTIKGQISKIISLQDGLTEDDLNDLYVLALAKHERHQRGE